MIVAPEQVTGRVTDPTRAALVDQWGRVHLLDPKSMIGRDLGADGGIAIHAPSVSRHHATLTLEQGVWTVRDLGSSNGTFIDDTRVETPLAIHAGDRLRFGKVAFYFLDHVEDIPINIIVDSDTVRPGAGGPTQRLPIEDPPTKWSEFQLHEPTGGGGGIVQIDGTQIQLTLAQLELVVMLTERMEVEADRPADLRGFVSVGELLGKISLEVSLPRDAHVRQLIRRVRRAFIKAGLGDLIESRYGLGYRIRLLKARR